jgi:Holliday junction DNA helicase RuvA
MISHLKGTVSHIDSKYLVLDVNSVGYKVYCTSDTLASAIKGSEVEVWTHLAVREDALDLYGFSSLQELGFFELLITVSGIGPKTALGVLNTASIESIHVAVESGDTSHLTKVSGLGKKLAEKIVLELRDKLDGVAGTTDKARSMSKDADAIEALKSLGYREGEARDVLKKMDKSISDTGEKIKMALKILGR